MTYSRLVLLVLVVVLIGFTIGVGHANHQRRRWRMRLAQLLHEGRYADFDQQIQDRALTRLFPPFSLAMMKLNALISAGENEAADAQFQQMEQFEMNAREAQDFYEKGFYHYLKQRDKERCANYLNKALSVLRDRYEKAKMDELYQIFLCQNTELEDAIRQRMEGKSAMECFREEYLLAQIYENRQELEQAALYRSHAYQHKHEMEEALEALRFDRRRKRRQQTKGEGM